MKLTTKLTALLLFILFFSACSKDEEPTPTDCTTLTTSATINGDDSYTMQSGTLLTMTGFDGTNYNFVISAVDPDCEEAITLNIVVEVSDDVGGTYPVTDFFSAGLNDAHGNLITQNIATASQSLSDLQSGSVTITDNGNSSYSIDFEGTLSNGEEASFAATHTF